MSRPLLFIIAAYLFGSIPTGVLLTRRSGVDIRSEGSGNIGATNVARTAGRLLGVLTLVGDLLKGLAPVLAARALGESNTTVGLVAVAAIVGHVFSVFLRFQGGKGVATGFGVLVGLAPAASLVPLGVFVVVIAASGIVSLASLSAAAAAPLTLWLFGHPSAVVVSALTISVVITWRHQENIRRLLAGTEARFRART